MPAERSPWPAPTTPTRRPAQFFINHADNQQLDRMGGGYCAFGEVIEGMDVVDRIAGAQTHNLGGAFTDIPVQRQW